MISFIAAAISNGFITQLAIMWTWSYYGQPSAVIWKEQLFVAITSSPGFSSQEFIPVGYLYRGAFKADQREVNHPVEYWNPVDTVRHYQPKLEVRNNSILLTAVGAYYYIVPLADLPLLEANEFGQLLCELRGHPHWSHFTSQFCGSRTRILFPEHRKPDVAALPYKSPFGNGSEPPPKEVYAQSARTDVQIMGAKTVRLFHAHRETLFVSIEPDYLNYWYLDKDATVAKNLPKPPDRELRTGKLPAEFVEDFAAYRMGGRDYLVTPSGKVYMVVPKGKTEVEVTAVWADPKQKIIGVVQDQADDAVYGWGFVTDNMAPERFYVKFDPKPAAKPYKRTVPLWKDRSNAYLESYECARAFRNADEKK